MTLSVTVSLSLLSRYLSKQKRKTDYILKVVHPSCIYMFMRLLTNPNNRTVVGSLSLSHLLWDFFLLEVAM